MEPKDVGVFAPDLGTLGEAVRRALKFHPVANGVSQPGKRHRSRELHEQTRIWGFGHVLATNCYFRCNAPPNLVPHSR